MNQTFTIKDDETEFLAGSSASSPARRSGQTVIPFKFQAPTAAALVGLEEASSLDTFESLGELAVRLCGQWSLPRVRVLMAAPGREEP